MSENTSISFVIPAFNEEDIIHSCVSNLNDFARTMKFDYEIIVTDDGSKDKTGEILKNLCHTVPQLVVVTHETNHGLGTTLRSGFNKATKKLVFYTDADLPIDFYEINRALRIMHVQQADLVAGFRHDRTSEGMTRIIYSFFYNILIRILFGVRIRDINFSFKLIKNQALQSIRLRSEGSFIDAEMVCKLTKSKYHIVQMGTDYFDRRYGDSKLSGIKTILKIIKELAGLRQEINQIQNVSKEP